MILTVVLRDKLHQFIDSEDSEKKKFNLINHSFSIGW